jgi:hypothetical protein
VNRRLEAAATFLVRTSPAGPCGSTTSPGAASAANARDPSRAPRGPDTQASVVLVARSAAHPVRCVQRGVALSSHGTR